MISDAIAYAKRCHACQIHGDFIHQAPRHLHSTSSLWPFEMWGMDIIGPISPPTSKRHASKLAITDYFSKWTKVIPLKEVKTSNMIKFIKHHVLYRFGVPQRIVHDNGPQFVNQVFQRFCNKFRIQSVSSTVYYPATNSLAEAFNKTIEKLHKKFVSKSQRNWDDKLGECLWAYRTTVRTLTKVTLFSLVYGCKAVLPLEIQIPSLHIAWRNIILKGILLMSKLTIHLLSRRYPDQSDVLEFEIQDVWESAKEKLPHSMDHITIDRRRADWTLVTLWHMMSTLKKWQR